MSEIKVTLDSYDEDEAIISFAEYKQQFVERLIEAGIPAYDAGHVCRVTTGGLYMEHNADSTLTVTWVDGEEANGK